MKATTQTDTTTWRDLTLVIMTCNRPDLAVVALDSIRSQTMSPGKVILTDDSCDGATAELAAKYQGLSICYRRGPGVGQSANLRSAVELVESTYLLVLHDDDRIYDGLIAAAHAAFAGHQTDLFVSGIEYIDASGKTVEHMTAARRATRANFLQPGTNDFQETFARVNALLVAQVVSPFQGTVIRKTLLSGWLASPARGDVEDYWINTHLAMRPFSLTYHERNLCAYRVHADTVSDRGGDYSLETIAIFQEVAAMPAFALMRRELETNARAKAGAVVRRELQYGSRSLARKALRKHVGFPTAAREFALWGAALLPTQHLFRMLARRKRA